MNAISILLFLASLTSQDKPVEGCEEAPATPGIMSAAFAHEKRDEQKLQRVFVGNPEEFAKGHLSRSAMLDIAWLRGEVNGVKGELLPPKDWTGKLAEQGIDSRYFILLYGNKVTDVTLAGWALTNAGHTQWYILDGGLAAWKGAGHEIEAGGTPGLGKKAEFVVGPAQDAQAKLPDAIAATQGKGGKLLDARPVEQLTGGYLKGSVNVPWPSLLQKDGTFKPIAELRKIFADAGVRDEEEWIVYCNSGHQASTDYFVLRHLLGMKKTRIWDGSLAEWKMDPSRSLEKP